MSLRIGIVGATGQVGEVMRRILLERGFPVAPRDGRAGRARGREEPDVGDREAALEQDPAHHLADLAGGTDDADAHAGHRPVPP